MGKEINPPAMTTTSPVMYMELCEINFFIIDISNGRKAVDWSAKLPVSEKPRNHMAGWIEELGEKIQTERIIRILVPGVNSPQKFMFSDSLNQNPSFEPIWPGCQPQWKSLEHRELRRFPLLLRRRNLYEHLSR